VNTGTSPSDVVAQLQGDQLLCLSDDEFAKGYVLMVVTQGMGGNSLTYVHSSGLSPIEKLGVTVQAAEVARWESIDAAHTGEDR
jgi:hypothetical protein